ncbi:unnamed protein product [Phaeothamnion confervicola]
MGEDEGKLIVESRLASHVARRPSSDPFGAICTALHMPKIGHQYVLSPPPPPPRRLCCVVGPHWSGLFYTASIVLVATLFMTHTAMRDFAPEYRAICVVFAALTLLFLMLTGCTNPGIVRQSAERRPDSRWCDECEIFISKGTQHCEDCAVCIEGHDHHCPWIGTCVGRGNWRWFQLFNVSWVCYILYASAVMVIRGGDE